MTLGSKLPPTHPKLQDGWFILDKPAGIGSTKALSKLKRAMGIKKLGHAGTLDPLASGVLPIAFGEATKTVSCVQQTQKTYIFTVTWGQLRDTGDEEGHIIRTCSRVPNAAEINSTLPQFMGEIQQIPPRYSAIKVHGKRSHALARAGEFHQLLPRSVHVHSLELLSHNQIQSRLRVECGKGTYVRSLAVDIAQALGTVGYVSALRRTKVGKFCEKNAFSLEKVLEEKDQSGLQRAWYSICEALDDILAITVSAENAEKLRHGQQIESVEQRDYHQRALCVSEKNVPVALVTFMGNKLKPVRVFNI